MQVMIDTKVHFTMTKYLLFIFFIVGHSAIGQNSNPTKSQLLQVLKKSIRQDSKGKVLTISNPWVVCNRDSSFYKSDTLRLYNNINFSQYSNCCDFIDLTFYKRNAFVVVRTQMCNEPTTASVIKSNDWFTIDILKIESDLIIKTINQGKVVDSFKAVSIDKIKIGQTNEITEVLTLVRQHRPLSR